MAATRRGEIMRAGYTTGSPLGGRRASGKDAAMSSEASRGAVVLVVLVAALGYFVDIFDLILFGVVRRPSLIELGVPVAELQVQGEHLVNMQMIGLLIGGLVWGVLGDKRGRLSVLFGSIITYSVANLLNGMVQDMTQYAVLRFVAGLGLAGELGAGITLVSEIMRREGRGWGTTIVATVGICGGVAASLIGSALHWRHAYYLGGGLGLLLLALRIGVRESSMFARTADSGVARGNVLALFATRDRAVRYLSVIAVAIPIWYVVGILVFFSSELGRAMGMAEEPVPGRALLWCYAGLAVGDLASGALSQVLGSRRRALAVFLVLTVAGVVAYFTIGARSLVAFYACCAFVGVATGYWAVFVTTASEQFGTNLRATVTTTAPNFVRGAVVPMTFAYAALRPSLGVVGGAVAIGAVVLALALLALRGLRETYGVDLDFVER
jgi:MFS transporter, putative metabolite:H+ symporter